MTLSTTKTLLEAEGISKSFGATKALQHVDLKVTAGSVHAVMGHNGAGKSTLMNLLSGAYPPDSGRFLIQGKPIRFNSPRDALNQGITMVHQELSIVPDLDVGENIFLGREPMAAGWSISRSAVGLAPSFEAVSLMRELARQAVRPIGDRTGTKAHDDVPRHRQLAHEIG